VARRHAAPESPSAIRTASPQQRSFERHAGHARADNFSALTTNQARSDRVIFVRPALFAPAFVTPGCGPSRAQSAEQSFICEMKQRCTPFVADVLIVARSGRSGEAQVAEMPFASPYCPYRAQIRRVQVQSRARFAVLPSMRVRSHASRLARAHHFTDSQNPW
jgi:hypothetical protein